MSSRTPLHWACNGGYGAIVGWALQNGADPNIIDKNLQTPLHIVSINHHRYMYDTILT